MGRLSQIIQVDLSQGYMHVKGESKQKEKCIACLEMKEAVNQVMWADSTSRKRQGNKCSSRVAEYKRSCADTYIFASQGLC